MPLKRTTRRGKEIAAIATVAELLEEHTDTLLTTAQDGPRVVRQWSLSRALPTGALRVAAAVLAEPAEGGEARYHDGWTYEQLMTYQEVLVGEGYGVLPVYEDWRVVALEVQPPPPAPTPRSGSKTTKAPRKSAATAS